MTGEPRSLRVVVVTFRDISPFHLAVPCVVFGDQHPGVPVFDFRVCAGEAGALSTTAGFEINVAHGLGALEKADWIVIPSWRDPEERPAHRLLSALRRAHGRGAVIVGLCMGAYVLAEAGLLDGLRATTHWSCTEDFATRYPAIQVQTNALYVDEGQVVTSAGTAAGLDCCVHLLRRHYGMTIANAVARRLVLPSHRQGGMAQFLVQPLPVSSRDARLSELMQSISCQLEKAHDVDSMAARLSLSRRHFTRRFRALVGLSPRQWLLGERLRYAQELLEHTSDPIERVALRAGFGSAVPLRQHFRKSFGISPSAWRQAYAKQ
jgi:transcriptional regulator GlxA family with amidase domain